MSQLDNQPVSIIVADDDKAVRLVIAQALTRQGYQVHTAATAAGMWDLSMSGRGGLLITDVGFPDGDALDMLPRLKARKPDLKVIVMSARANLLTALKSQQRGVIDYLPKPFELKQLIAVTKQALASDKMAAPFHDEIDNAGADFPPLMGRSSAMQDIYKLLARLATQIVPVLIEAEPGSAKAEVARAIHIMGENANAAIADNTHHDYVVMNCAQISPDQHESHLFGQDGVIEQAAGGTLFINNIDLLDHNVQLRLIGALENQKPIGSDRPWPRRFLVGTVKDLRQLVENDLFREDLYFAISVAPVRLPPLRQRRDDIPALANYFCKIANDDFNTDKSLSHDAITYLRSYDWPGNIRELEFILRRVIVTIHKTIIEASDIKAEIEGQAEQADTTTSGSLAEAAQAHIASYFEALGDTLPHTGLYDRIMEEVERPLIIQTLHLTKGNQIKAAQILGLNRNTLRKKIDWLHISKDRKDYRD